MTLYRKVIITSERDSGFARGLVKHKFKHPFLSPQGLLEIMFCLCYHSNSHTFWWHLQSNNNIYLTYVYIQQHARISSE